MAEETQFTGNTGMVAITTSNAYLDGQNGSYSTVIVADNAKNGLLINTVTIKATTDTTQSMVRLFINDGAGSGSAHTKLVAEIEVPAVTKSASDPAFEITIPVEFALKPDWELWASIEFATGSPSFNVIAAGKDWNYYTNSVRPESSKYTANTGMATISAQNTALTGAGTQGTDIWDVLTAASNGTNIKSVTIKSLLTGLTSVGMVRLFINNGGGDGTNYNKLLTEIPVNATTQSATARSFSKKIDFGGKGFFLKSSWKLRATTQTNDDFNIIAEGLDLSYPA